MLHYYLYCLDIKTGKVLWRREFDSGQPPGGRHHRSEFVAWSQPHGGTHLPTEVAYDGALYALSETGILNRFDAKTGKLSYESRIDAGRIPFGTALPQERGNGTSGSARYNSDARSPTATRSPT